MKCLRAWVDLVHFTFCEAENFTRFSLRSKSLILGTAEVLISYCAAIFHLSRKVQFHLSLEFNSLRPKRKYIFFVPNRQKTTSAVRCLSFFTPSLFTKESDETEILRYAQNDKFLFAYPTAGNNLCVVPPNFIKTLGRAQKTRPYNFVQVDKFFHKNRQR